MGRLTEPQVQDLYKARGKVAGVSDGDGLTFNISAKGTAVWVLRYRFGNKPRELTLGRYPDLSLKAARVRAGKERSKISEGLDVAAEKRHTKAARAAAQTFKQLGEDYLQKHAENRAHNTLRELRRYLDTSFLPAIGHLTVDAITPADIATLIERLGKRSRPTAARGFTYLRSLFDHYLGRHPGKLNPCSSLKLMTLIGAQTPVRKLVALSEAELTRLLPALNGIGRSGALATRIILATAVRKMQMVNAKWKNVDLEQGLWTVPVEDLKLRTETKLAGDVKPFIIPLVPTVVDWLRELQERAPGSEWVLPGRNGKQHIAPSTLNLALDRLDVPGVRSHSIHDLRRTTRSLLCDVLKVNVIVAEKYLGHKLGGLLEVYDHGDYLEDRKVAMERLVALMQRCEAGNVLPLRREAA